MKRIFLITILCVLVFSVKAQNNKTAPLFDIVQKISNSLQDVDAADTSGIKLESVTASFTISKTTSIGGGLNLWIFKLGRKREKTKLSTVTLELKKGNPAARVKKANDDATELTNFLKATLADFKKLKDQQLIPKLSDRKVTIELGLTIKKDSSVGGGYEIGIFTLSAEGGRNSEEAHTLTLVFTQ